MSGMVHKDRVLGREKVKILRPHEVEGYEATDSFTDEDESDQKVIQQMNEMGADLSKERHSVYYFYFTSEQAVQGACDALQQLHFLVSRGERLEDAAPDQQWPLIAERTEIVNLDVIRGWRSPLHEIAQRYGGVYDGWEAAAD